MMVFEILSYLFTRLWEILQTSWRYPPQALPRMRLRPVQGGGDENALMVCRCLLTNIPRRSREMVMTYLLFPSDAVLYMGGQPS